MTTRINSLLDELHDYRGDLLYLQAARTSRLDEHGYYLEPDEGLKIRIADITEQIELAEVMAWLDVQPNNSGWVEDAADAQERADLYRIGMGG